MISVIHSASGTPTEDDMDKVQVVTECAEATISDMYHEAQLSIIDEAYVTDNFPSSNAVIEDQGSSEEGNVITYVDPHMNVHLINLSDMFYYMDLITGQRVPTWFLEQVQKKINSAEVK